MIKYIISLLYAVHTLEAAQPIVLTNLSQLPQISLPFPYTNVLLYAVKVTTNGANLVYSPYKMTLTLSNLQALLGTTNIGGGGTSFSTAVGLTNDATVLLLKLAAGTNVVFTTNGNAITISTPSTNLATAVGLTNSSNVLLLQLAAGTNTVFTTNGNQITVHGVAGVNSTGTPVAGNLTIYPGTSPTNITPTASFTITGTNMTGAGQISANLLVGTNGVSGDNFTGTGATANSDLELPDDDASAWLTWQAYDTMSGQVRVIGPIAGFGGIPYYNQVSGTNMYMTNLTVGTGLSIVGTTLNSTGTPGGSTTQIQYNNAGAFDGAVGMTVDSTETNFFISKITATNVVSVLHPSSQAELDLGDTDDSNLFALVAFSAITTNVAWVSPAFPLPTASLVKVVTSGTVTNKAGTVSVAQYLTNAIAGTDYSVYNGSSGTVIGAGTTVANDIAVFTDTTHTNIARSTSAARVGDNSAATVVVTGDVSGTDTTLTFGSGALTSSGSLVATTDVTAGASNGHLFSGRGGLYATGDGVIVWKDNAGTGFTSVSLGPDDATPNAGTLKSPSGSGTDIAGGDLILEGGVSTGTGRGGDVSIRTSTTATGTGSSANLQTTRYKAIPKWVTLTEASATTVATIAVPSGKIAGGTITVTVNANDATDFQCRTLVLAFSAVNKAGTVTAAVATSGTSTEAIAVSTGTLTAAITAVANGNAVDLKVNATSSLTQTTLQAWVVLNINSNDTAAVTEI